jgi:hypothetical protein
VRAESRKILGLDSDVNAKPKKIMQREKKVEKVKKTNLSVALFDREETACESVCSTESRKCENKENRVTR